jgi:hypothetical protein
MKTTTCPKTRKVRFRDELDAKIALSGRVRRDKGECRHYRCPHCAGFHLTSKPKKGVRK